MLFQEFLEDILCRNDNLKIISGDKSSFIIANLDRARAFHITPSNDFSNFFIKRINNCYIDTMNEDVTLSMNELEDFLVDCTVNLISLESIDRYIGRKDITLLGIFIQPIFVLEKKFGKNIPSSYEDINFYVDIDGKKSIISLGVRGKMNEDGSDFETFGDVKVLSINKGLDIKKAIYVPTSKVLLSIEKNSTDAYFFARKEGDLKNNFLANINIYNKRDFFSIRQLRLNLPSSIFSGYFNYNEKSSKEIASLTPLYEPMKLRTLVGDYFTKKE